MKAVILAGGLGKRLRPFTQIFPKPLLPVGERSVLDIQIALLKKHGIDEVFLATFYKSDLIRTYFEGDENTGVKITVSEEKEPLGTCGPLSLLKDKLTETFIVMNGDILTNFDFGPAIRFHEAHDGPLTVISKEMTWSLSYGKLEISNGVLTGYREKPDMTYAVASGIYLMRPEIFNYIPENTYFGIDNLIQKFLAENIEIHCYPMAGYWLDIGKTEDYEKAQSEYKEIFEPGA